MSIARHTHFVVRHSYSILLVNSILLYYLYRVACAVLLWLGASVCVRNILLIWKKIKIKNISIPGVADRNMTNMTKINVIAYFIVILLSTTILSTHCARVIFRQNNTMLGNSKDATFGPSDTPTPTDVATGNIITAPQHCGPGFLIDERKICRKVSLNICPPKFPFLVFFLLLMALCEL